jgi:nitronate monooxygenase
MNVNHRAGPRDYRCVPHWNWRSHDRTRRRRSFGSGRHRRPAGHRVALHTGGGDHCPHRQALLDARYPDTILTRAHSGRFARGLANRFALDHDGQAPQAYPEVHHLTRPLRAETIQAADTSVPNLWAGTGWRQLTAEPAATIVRRIGDEAS